MNREEKYTLYEKLYFQENETKEKLHARVQGVFAFFALISTAIAYVFKNLTRHEVIDFYAINSLLITSSIILVAAALRLKQAFWGNQYARLATPKEISNYEQELHLQRIAQREYNEKHPDHALNVVEVEDKLKDWICGSFEVAASHNMNVNSLRSEKIHEAVFRMFISLIPLVIALIIFVSLNLDGSAPRNAASLKSSTTLCNSKPL